MILAAKADKPPPARSRRFHSNALTSLATMSPPPTRARATGRPTVLVGHSWGGTVITEAGIDAKVAALVYVSALSPDAGETTSDQYAGFSTPLEFVIDTLPDGFGIVNPDEIQGRLRR